MFLILNEQDCLGSQQGVCSECDDLYARTKLQGATKSTTCRDMLTEGDLILFIYI